jgi:signal transduction histidine kinase
MAQEALRNGLVHGGARHLSVSLARAGSDIELTVSDDGSGFDPEAVRGNGSGLGLVSMEERAYALGGTLKVISARGLGTTIAARVPATATTAREPSTTSASVWAPPPDADLATMERV